VINDDLTLIDALAGPITALDAQIRQRAKNEPGVAVLTQLPGVGEFTALVILAETGETARRHDRHRDSRRRALAARPSLRRWRTSEGFPPGWGPGRLVRIGLLGVGGGWRWAGRWNGRTPS
jgi:hypothetical protein